MVRKIDSLMLQLDLIEQTTLIQDRRVMKVRDIDPLMLRSG